MYKYIGSNFDYWLFENGNRYSKENYSRQHALKLVETLTDCENCTDCFSCRKCINCTECSRSSNCVDCYNCYSCNSCENCIDCELCIHCEECSECYMCNGGFTWVEASRENRVEYSLEV